MKRRLVCSAMLACTTMFYACSRATGADTSATQPDLPAAPKDFDARNADAPKGKIETVEYDSKAVGAKRKMVIYTSPGYSTAVKYPVFYLLHGAGDDETGWQKKGSADAILDNLYAAKKIVPMIVVMPNGFARPAGAPSDWRAQRRPHVRI